MSFTRFILYYICTVIAYIIYARNAYTYHHRPFSIWRNIPNLSPCHTFATIIGLIVGIHHYTDSVRCIMMSCECRPLLYALFVYFFFSFPATAILSSTRTKTRKTLYRRLAGERVRAVEKWFFQDAHPTVLRFTQGLYACVQTRPAHGIYRARTIYCYYATRVGGTGTRPSRVWETVLHE